MRYLHLQREMVLFHFRKNDKFAKTIESKYIICFVIVKCIYDLGEL